MLFYLRCVALLGPEPASDQEYRASPRSARSLLYVVTETADTTSRSLRIDSVRESAASNVTSGEEWKRNQRLKPQPKGASSWMLWRCPAQETGEDAQPKHLKRDAHA